MNDESRQHVASSAKSHSNWWSGIALATLVLLTPVSSLQGKSSQESELAIVSAQDCAAGAVNIQGLEIDTKVARIRSKADLDVYLRESVSADDPFQSLSATGLRHFMDGLVFTELGLASFDASTLQAELTPTQIYRLLGLLGLQRLAPLVAADARAETDLDRAIHDLAVELANESTNLPDDRVKCPIIPNAECVPPATCRSAIQAWCVTCNCGMIPP